ncbi:vWA domain-containing protein [Pseudoxanthomonas winnipegensis]|uniref:VWA domain-containing protein n=1 Tax=Pseudoxanthomonas winnipegensis TaxID=2480810 RepID=A0A4Q8LWS6_9GAMM|nr:VWA domain-containing protein [Pseudoxanthomonas winnipegensis]RZZ85800.1 VWA domain-containing protein [Pseudoxanthomonas winnipegensis]TAA35989.1 VWA domain-containing protein [Pseudoxanthomonas winnipegensis]
MRRTPRTCLSLLIAAVLAACSSTPPSPAARERAMAAEAAEQAAIAANSYQSARLFSPPAPPAPPPPPPMPQRAMRMAAAGIAAPLPAAVPPPPAVDTERYAHQDDNPVRRTDEQPVSTFSIDVDTGSYSNVRRMVRAGERPPADAVRAEEFINYFDYHHPAPESPQVPFRVTTQLAPAPWNSQRQVLMIGIKGYALPKRELPPSNLVFLIDTSGSMDAPDKLPLLKQSLALLVPQLRAQDRVSIVVYAGSAGLVLPPTPGDAHAKILAALDRLEAGGSTNGGAGIALAYAMARQAFIPGGSNRVLLATDGDFNVGTVDQRALETLVGDARKAGVALSTLGFGQGNYNDELAERLADVGDGQHAYIDSDREARKVLVQQLQGTLLTIARDVKIQVEFNPAAVAEYRLIGYENRALAREDFANDKVDAGDIGAGHEVTALYELTPAGSGAARLPALRYGASSKPSGDAREVADLRLRYKRPGEDTSRLIEVPILASSAQAQPGDALRFASAVAGYADLLRGGTRFDGWGWDQVIATARAASGEDADGLRHEFVELAGQARTLVAPGQGEGMAVAPMPAVVR